MRNNIGFPNKNSQHDRRRHHVQHLGPEHHPGRQRLRQHLRPQRLDDRHAIEASGALGPRAGRRQPAGRRLPAPGRGEPHDRQGDQRRVCRSSGAAPDLGAYEYGATADRHGRRDRRGGSTARAAPPAPAARSAPAAPRRTAGSSGATGGARAAPAARWPAPAARARPAGRARASARGARRAAARARSGAARDRQSSVSPAQRWARSLGWARDGGAQKGRREGRTKERSACDPEAHTIRRARSSHRARAACRPTT